MYRFIIVISILTVLISVPEFVHAKDSCISHDCVSCHTLNQKEAAELLKPLELSVKSVKHAPVSGMFEVLAERSGTEGIVYIDYGKKYLMQGVIVDAKKLSNVSAHPRPETSEKKLPVIDPKTIPAQLSIVMGNPNGSKKLYVFTDPDCPYCRKFHAELIKLEKMVPDVAIHIMLFPLPMHAQAFDKSRILLVNKSRKLLDEAFEGKELSKPVGDEGTSEITAIIKFAQEHGINGTPTVILTDGTTVVGGRDAEALKKILSGDK
jgi:thiol:disulfide interchange protein DsbC